MVDRLSRRSRPLARLPELFAQARSLTLPGLVACLLALAACSGCDPGQSGARGPAGTIPDANWRQDLFESSIDSIDHLEEFNAPEMLAQAVQGLNQSLAAQESGDDPWRPDPLVFSLPLEYRQLPAVKNLGSPHFDAMGALELQEAFWLRDASRAARGSRSDDLSRALNLFDWTVRNIQLRPDPPPEGEYDLIHSPRQLLLLGHGDAWERAWLFILLARQQGLDVVMLGIPDDSQPHGYRPWLPALLSGGELYLFDTRLGLPIPGPDGQPVATLAQVAADESLLSALDVEGEPYPFRSADVQQVTALIEASPPYLSRRMRLVELRLTGERKLALTVPASSLADRLRSCDHVSDARLWDLPYREVVQHGIAEARAATAKALEPYRVDLFPKDLRPVAAVLQQGRVMQIRGKYAQEAEDLQASSANALLQMARLPDDELARFQLDELQRYLVDHTRHDASYWLGLVAFERGRYVASVEHLKKRTLEASPDGHWTSGARYNLARCYEALGRTDEAIELYQSDTSPQRHGNQLRARRLQQQTDKPAAN